MSDYCEYAFEHIDMAGETCPHCELEVNEFGNTEADFRNCSFPCCGCDGARLCMASEGPSEDSNRCNVENMYNRTDKQAVRGRMETYGLSLKLKQSNQ